MDIISLLTLPTLPYLPRNIQFCCLLTFYVQLTLFPGANRVLWSSTIVPKLTKGLTSDYPKFKDKFKNVEDKYNMKHQCE